MTRRAYADLRSARWMVPDDQRSFGHRSRTMQMGYDPADWEGRPMIAVINTWSDAQPCHMHFKDRVEWVKRGVLQAGASRWSCRRCRSRRPSSSRRRCSTATCSPWRPRSSCARTRWTGRC